VFCTRSRRSAKFKGGYLPSVSHREFFGLLASVDQLIDMHERLQSGRGRRHKQDALHRAGVVLTVAAWQAYVEKILNEALDKVSDDLDNPPGGIASPNWAKHTFKMRRAAIRNNISKFNTPNSENVRTLLRDGVDFDPWPFWEYRTGPRQWSSAEVRTRTNKWVLVRHSVAHGFPLPGDVDWLQDDNGSPRLTLGLLKECRKHFVHLVNQTDSAFSAHLSAQHGIVAPW
jgi:hypothetical protein